MKIYFLPQQDISAFELACIFARISSHVPPRHGVNISESQWDSLAPEIKKHWSLEPPKD
jgi:hypothetical protein